MVAGLEQEALHVLLVRLLVLGEEPAVLDLQAVPLAAELVGLVKVEEVQHVVARHRAAGRKKRAVFIGRRPPVRTGRRTGQGEDRRPQDHLEEGHVCPANDENRGLHLKLCKKILRKKLRTSKKYGV